MDTGDEIAENIMCEFGWLSRQPERLRREIFARCTLVHMEAGGIIYRPGQEFDGVYGVASGVVELDFANGHVGFTRTSGYWIGEAAAFLGAARHVSIVAKTDANILHLPRAEFEHLIADAEFCRCFAALTAEHLAEALGIIDCLMAPDPMARMCGRLLDLSRAQSRADLPLMLTHSELASMCGVTRQTVAKVLKKLADDGVVSLKYRALLILDPLQLSQPSPPTCEGSEEPPTGELFSLSAWRLKRVSLRLKG
jgi:CRP/FNR family transcriptional regulator, cyclic AMP receptor protein